MKKKINLSHFAFSMDFNTTAEQTVGMHEGAIRCVEFCAAIGKLLYC